MELEILTTVLAALLLLLVQHGQMVESFGYSYSRFIGPVRGPERQIIVHDRYDGRGRVDYVARPEYHFAYGVEDAKTRVLQNRRETRNGDAVKGVYSVVDPDGSLRVVKYTADNVNGFQAEVVSNGVSRIHGQDNPVVHPPPVAAGNNQVIDKDNSSLHRQYQQHPVEEDANVHKEAGGLKKKSQDEDEHEDDGDADDSASGPKDTSDYEEKDDGGSEEQEGSSEEFEDY